MLLQLGEFMALLLLHLRKQPATMHNEANMHALFLSEVGRDARAAQAQLEREQMACHLTHTTAATHALIEANLAETPVYGGWVDAAGPRYCPSIEDKVVRFADKASHQARLHPTRFICPKSRTPNPSSLVRFA